MFNDKFLVYSRSSGYRWSGYNGSQHGSNFGSGYGNLLFEKYHTTPKNQKSSKQLLFILLNYPHKFVYPLYVPSLCLDIFHGLLFSPIVGWQTFGLQGSPRHAGFECLNVGAYLEARYIFLQWQTELFAYHNNTK